MPTDPPITFGMNWTADPKDAVSLWFWGDTIRLNNMRKITWSVDELDFELGVTRAHP